MKVRRLTFVLVFVLCALAAGSARAADGCADGLMPFQKADLFFSSAERADSTTAKTLWTFGTQLLQQHRDDPPPENCDGDRFALTKITVIEHGLRTGYTFAGLSVDEASRRAGLLLNAAAYEARGKRTLSDVYAAWKRNDRDLFDRSMYYVAQFERDVNAAMLARHTPSGAGCAQPNVDVEVSTPVTPSYPDEAKDLKIHDVTVLATVAVDPEGKIQSISILQSSGNMFLDRNALAAARQTRYFPKIQDCKPVAGTYVFKATFDRLQ